MQLETSEGERKPERTLLKDDGSASQDSGTGGGDSE